MNFEHVKGSPELVVCVVVCVSTKNNLSGGFTLFGQAHGFWAVQRADFLSDDDVYYDDDDDDDDNGEDNRDQENHNQDNHNKDDNNTNNHKKYDHIRADSYLSLLSLLILLGN